MILRNTFLNKIRALDYTLKSETKRVHIWRKKGGTHFITVHKTDKLEDEFVKSALAQAGMKDLEIKAFIDLYAVSDAE
jgi:hypothetical protein